MKLFPHTLLLALVIGVSGCQVKPRGWGRVELLGSRGISSVLVEGGSGVITSMIRSRLADRVVAFIAPRILGEGTPAVGDLGIDNIDKAVSLSVSRVKRLGGDVVLEGRLEYPEDRG